MVLLVCQDMIIVHSLTYLVDIGHLVILPNWLWMMLLSAIQTDYSNHLEIFQEQNLLQCLLKVSTKKIVLVQQTVLKMFLKDIGLIVWLDKPFTKTCWKVIQMVCLNRQTLWQEPKYYVLLRRLYLVKLTNVRLMKSCQNIVMEKQFLLGLKFLLQKHLIKVS